VLIFPASGIAPAAAVEQANPQSSSSVAMCWLAVDWVMHAFRAFGKTSCICNGMKNFNCLYSIFSPYIANSEQCYR
jgi:hypothetical protein